MRWFRAADAIGLLLAMTVAGCAGLTTPRGRACEFGAIPEGTTKLSLEDVTSRRSSLNGHAIAVRGFYHYEYESEKLWVSREDALGTHPERFPSIEVVQFEKHVTACTDRMLLVYGDFEDGRFLGVATISPIAVRVIE